MEPEKIKLEIEVIDESNIIIGRKRLRAFPSSGCADCDLKMTNLNCLCILFRFGGTCLAKSREDKTNVIWKIIE